MGKLLLIYILKAALGAAMALGGLGPAAPLALDQHFRAASDDEITASPTPGRSSTSGRSTGSSEPTVRLRLNRVRSD